MKMMKTILWSIMLFSAIAFVGCSKDDDSKTSDDQNNSGTTTTGGKDYVAPTLAKDTLIKIPATMREKADNGGDFNLSMGVVQIDIVNAFSSQLSGAFFYDETTTAKWQSTKNSDGSKSYTWKYLQYAYKLTYYHSASESWWKYEMDSSTYAYPYYYIQDKGTSGKTEWYSQQNYKAPSRIWYRDAWTKNGTTYNATFDMFNEEQAVETEYVSTSNADKSGTLKIYQLSTDSKALKLTWDYKWNAAGTGTYTNYKEDGTTVNFTGDF